MNIKRNDYVQPTDVRDWVVEGICQVFLSGCAWSVFHAVNDGYGRYKTTRIIKHKNENNYYGFHHRPFADDDSVVFNGAEMKKAFEVLQEHGYYMFKVYTYGTWEGYICSKKPFHDGGVRVTTFDGFID